MDDGFSYNINLCADSLYQLLMELAQTRGQAAVTTQIKAAEPESESLSALACSCLISLVIARGDTGKLLTAVAAMLMFSARLAKQEVKASGCCLHSFLYFGRELLANLYVGRLVVNNHQVANIRYFLAKTRLKSTEVCFTQDNQITRRIRSNNLI